MWHVSPSRGGGIQAAPRDQMMNIFLKLEPVNHFIISELGIKTCESSQRRLHRGILLGRPLLSGEVVGGGRELDALCGSQDIRVVFAQFPGRRQYYPSHVAVGSGDLMEANSLLYVLIRYCRPCSRQRLAVAAALVAVRTERAVAKVSGGPHTPLPPSPASQRLSRFSSPSLLPNKVPELRASGMPPSLSSGIRVRHLERGRWQRKTTPKH